MGQVHPQSNQNISPPVAAPTPGMTTTVATETTKTPFETRIAQWTALQDPRERLDLSNLNLTDFDGLLIPRTCTRLVLDKNRLTRIPTPLPPQLEHLLLDDNRIRSYDASDLPDTLTILIITKNSLKKLPGPLPPSLRYLFASNNRLTELPTTFPSALENISIHNNFIKTFPVLPPSITHIYASFNDFAELPDQMPPCLVHAILTGNAFLIPQTREEEQGAPLQGWIESVQAAQETVSKERILARTDHIKEELLARLFHPDRMMELFNAGLLFTLMTDYTVTECAEARQQWGMA